jgi:hypothetical protein
MCILLCMLHTLMNNSTHITMYLLIWFVVRFVLVTYWMCGCMRNVFHFSNATSYHVCNFSIWDNKVWIDLILICILLGGGWGVGWRLHATARVMLRQFRGLWHILNNCLLSTVKKKDVNRKDATTQENASSRDRRKYCKYMCLCVI